MNDFTDLTGLYPLSKTLSFKLVPIGRTLENIKDSGILQADTQMAEDFSRLTALADEYHKKFIDEVLERTGLKVNSTGDLDSLSEYWSLFTSSSRDADIRRQLKTVTENLRRQVCADFSTDSRFAKLNRKEFVTELLDGFCSSDDRDVVDSFKRYTTYLTGYNRNRMLLYSPDSKYGSIAARLIDENLPVFCRNAGLFTQVSDALSADVLAGLYRDFESYLNVSDIRELFDISCYPLLLTQKQIDVYNAVIGGIHTPDSHVPGLNELVNVHNSRLPAGQKKLPLLKQLMKQLLTDREKISWGGGGFTSDRQMLQAVRDFHRLYMAEVHEPLALLLGDIASYDAEGVFIRGGRGLSDISHDFYGHWHHVEDELVAVYSARVTKKGRKESEDSFIRRVKAHIASIECFSLADMNRFMFIHEKDIRHRFSAEAGAGGLFTAVIDAYAAVRRTVEREWSEDDRPMQNRGEVDSLKVYMDAVLRVFQFVKPLDAGHDMPSRDMLFYSVFDRCFEILSGFVQLYNGVRSHVTRKPYSETKLKLNFGNPALLSGWSASKEREYRNILLRRDGTYYLAILGKDGYRHLKDLPVYTGADAYEKMVYELMGDASKMIPKVAFAKGNENLYRPSDEILRIRREGSYKAGPTFNRADMVKFIDFYKEVVIKHPRWSLIDWGWKPSDRYANIKEFTDSFTGKDYSVSFVPVSPALIDRLTDSGDIYLFRIHKRDFSPYSKGKKSLHTLYFDMLFDPRNLRSVVYKLSGGAAMYFRPASIRPGRPTHPAGQPIENKRSEVRRRKSCSTFPYDLVKDRRYTEDMFRLDLPVSINYSCPEGRRMPVTAAVRSLIRQGAFRHIIGIHRGIRNLLYLTVIDMTGRVVEQRSLNVISDSYNGMVHEKDYALKLQEREQQQKQQARSWQSVSRIKELKEGYLSQAISIVTDSILKYQAVVVMESAADRGVHRSQKIEKGVFRQFETKLVEKLNFLVKKDFPAESAGGVLHGMQLTDRLSDVPETCFQNGIIFYVPSSHTMTLDPLTGFVNMFSLRYDNMQNVRTFFSKFDSVRFDAARGCFLFSFDYNRFNDRAASVRSVWTLSSAGCRVEHVRDDGFWHSRQVDLTAELKTLFTGYGSDLQGDLRGFVDGVDVRAFYEQLVRLFNLTAQVANISRSMDEDYVVSPVLGNDGTVGTVTGDVGTDANTAYNLARKGLLAVRRVAASAEGENPRLAVSATEWLRYAQGLDT